MKLRFFAAVPVLVICLCGASSISVQNKDIKETSVIYNKKRERVYCYKTTPGTIQVKSRKMYFTSFATTLSHTSKTKSKKSYDRLKALVSLGKAVCKKISNPTPTPTPTPTPPPSTGNFDIQGTTTEAGRVLFGIPVGLSGNITVGRGVFTAKCVGCHVERTNYIFPVVREKIKMAPMLYDEAQIPDQDLANLIAYLNRFRP